MKPSILLVDDDYSLTWLLERILEKKFKVSVAPNGIWAMKMISDGFLPDLIISDIKMPELNGIELVQLLKKSEIYKDIPIIILSGMNIMDYKAKCIEDGVYEYLSKPFDPIMLFDTIDSALDSYTMPI